MRQAGPQAALAGSLRCAKPCKEQQQQSCMLAACQGTASCLHTFHVCCWVLETAVWSVQVPCEVACNVVLKNRTTIVNTCEETDKEQSAGSTAQHCVEQSIMCMNRTEGVGRCSRPAVVVCRLTATDRIVSGLCCFKAGYTMSHPGRTHRPSKSGMSASWPQSAAWIQMRPIMHVCSVVCTCRLPQLLPTCPC